MNLVVIGAGGLRTPMFVNSAARRAKRLGIERITLADVDPNRLDAITDLCRMLLAREGMRLRLSSTTDMRRAVRGADFVVLTIRVGGDRARILDEKVAIEQGVIGQETTGPGGFAMAIRSIPAVLEYADLIDRLAPSAWIVNFTNPAGLVTQALRDAGFKRSVGICDSADHLRRYAAKHLGTDKGRLGTRVFGLNHLSFAESVTLGKKELAPGLIADRGFLETFYGIFDPAWIRKTRLFPNEYLHYYFHHEQALDDMKSDRLTRGEKVQALSRRFFRGYNRLRKSGDRKALPDFYRSVIDTRHGSYMENAWKAAGESRPHFGQREEEEGYAGVALEFVAAVLATKPKRMILSVPGEGALAGLSHHDVMEVSCSVSRQGIVTDRFDPPHPEAMELIGDVKRFENLTVGAVRARRFDYALDALNAHPLVPFHSMAQNLLRGYRKAHGMYLKGWK